MKWGQRIVWGMFSSSLIILTACEKASTTLVSIPSVGLECSASQNTDCHSGANSSCTTPPVVQGVVVMTRSGCGSSASFEPVATGSVSMNCDSSGCDGTVSNWVDPQTNDDVTEVLTGRMDICSYIDLSCNLTEYTGDLSDSSSESIQSSSTIIIDSWSEI